MGVVPYPTFFTSSPIVTAKPCSCTFKRLEMEPRKGDLKAIFSLLRERSQSNAHLHSVPSVGRSAQQNKLCEEEKMRFGSGEKSGVLFYKVFKLITPPVLLRYS